MYSITRWGAWLLGADPKKSWSQDYLTKLRKSNLLINDNSVRMSLPLAGSYQLEFTTDAGLDLFNGMSVVVNAGPTHVPYISIQDYHPPAKARPLCDWSYDKLMNGNVFGLNASWGPDNCWNINFPRKSFSLLLRTRDEAMNLRSAGGDVIRVTFARPDDWNEERDGRLDPVVKIFDDGKDGSFTVGC